MKRWAWVPLVAAAVAACGTGCQGGDLSCPPGVRATCRCAGGATGLQVCGPGGSRGPCECGTGGRNDAGADDGAVDATGPTDGAVDGCTPLTCVEAIDGGLGCGVDLGCGVTTDCCGSDGVCKGGGCCTTCPEPPDAGLPRCSGPDVVCGSTICSGAMPECCGGIVCAASGQCPTDSCPSNVNVVFPDDCDDAADCPPGQVCCEYSTCDGGSPWISHCATSCQSPFETQLCAADCECPAGSSCQPWPYGIGSCR